MATSAFKSTTKGASIGGGFAPRSLTGRSRSVSRPHRSANEPDYADAPRGKFVNTTRGSTTPTFTEISLDDLAMEFFSDSQSSNSKNEGVQGNDDRKGRSASRRVERWASDTASSSRRRVRSVSRTRGSGVRDVEVPSGGSKSVHTTRRRSMSVARYQLSDSESDAGQSRDSRIHVNQRSRVNGNIQLQNQAASSNRRLSRSQRREDILPFRDGYSSHSSAMTDDEHKATRAGKNGFEKTVQAVYPQKAKNPSMDVSDAGLYVAMKKELRYAVEEIRTEVNQAVARNQTTFRSDDLLDNYDSHQDFREGYAAKFEQLEAHKAELLKEMLLEEQRGRERSRFNDRERANSRTYAIADRRSRSRKRNSGRGILSNDLTDEAEKDIEEFISNLEDIDLTSFDGEISDGSSSFGGSTMTRSSAKPDKESHRTPEPQSLSSHNPLEMDGVALPWLKWETNQDSPFTVENNSQTPVTPKTLQWDTEKDVKNPMVDPSSSSYGSCSPSVYGNNVPLTLTDKRGGQIDRKKSSLANIEEYCKLQKTEDLLFEMYKERNRISAGGLLLCSSGFY